MLAIFGIGKKEDTVHDYKNEITAEKLKTEQKIREFNKFLEDTYQILPKKAVKKTQ